jgi:hypothetical protein
MSCARVVAVAALALAACAKSHEEELLEDRQEICAGLVPGSFSVRRAAAAFGSGQVPFDHDRDCVTGLVVLTNDRCGAVPATPADHHPERLCRREWLWTSMDATLCNALTGCDYFCEVYSPPSADGQAVDDSVICAARFVRPYP